MDNKIIILSGKQLSGKDTVAKILLEYLTDFRRIGLGDAIKLEYSEKKGLTLDEIEKNKATYRHDLITLGNKRRSEDPDYWIKKIINLPYNIVVPDIRMKRELEVFKSANAFSIRVEASLIAREKRGKLASVDDITETQLDNIFDWDYVILNNGTYDELLESTSSLLNTLKENFLKD